VLWQRQWSKDTAADLKASDEVEGGQRSSTGCGSSSDFWMMVKLTANWTRSYGH